MITTLSRVKDAQEYIEKVARGELWVAVARDYTWEDELSPPILSPYLEVIPDLICIVQVKDASLSKIVNQHLESVSLNLPIRELVLENAYFVELSAFIPTQYLPNTLSYRLTAIISNVSLNTSALSPLYLSKDIRDYDIDWYKTHVEIETAAGEVHKINIVREF